MKEIELTRRQMLALSGALGLAGLTGTFAAGAEAARTKTSSYEDLILAGGPVGYWRLDEKAGPTAVDASPKKHPGTYHGRPVFRAPGALKDPSDRAILLDGKASYVEIPSRASFSQPTSHQGLSVEAWLRTPHNLAFRGEDPNDPDRNYIYWLGKGEGVGATGQQEWALRFYSKNSSRPNWVSAYIFNPDGHLGAGAHFEGPVRPLEWIHVVACYQPGDAGSPEKRGVLLYTNGIFRQGPPASGTLYNHPKHWEIYPKSGHAPVRLGTRDKTTYLTGGLDEVAIYPRVLTAREIHLHYQVGTGAKLDAGERQELDHLLKKE
ncbi:MAG: LamG domain-containing protein [Planctomycetes bacterium]|nr:LamG domain-containing protein [Planctomycetota bacterium]